MTKIGFIGAGNMGYAIMKGIATKMDNNDIELYAYDLFEENLKRVNQIGVKSAGSESELASICKYVFLAVKPQQLETPLLNIKDSVNEDTVIISICAGISDEYIKKMTIPNIKVILVMPNTPLLLGEGATALSKAEPVTDVEFKLVFDIFSICGTACEISKDKMKEIIAINGSSPAFIYLFTKAFVDYAKGVGISEDTAKELFSKSLIGSAKMITDSGNSLDKLIEMVSSKGGTTIAGLEKLREGNLEDTIKNCCKACTNRAYELSK